MCICVCVCVKYVSVYVYRQVTEAQDLMLKEAERVDKVLEVGNKYKKDVAFLRDRLTDVNEWGYDMWVQRCYVFLHTLILFYFIFLFLFLFFFFTIIASFF